MADDIRSLRVSEAASQNAFSHRGKNALGLKLGSGGGIERRH